LKSRINVRQNTDCYNGLVCLPAFIRLYRARGTPGISIEGLKDRILVPEMPSTREGKPGKKVSPAPVPDRPISLQEAIAIALKNNHTLRKAFEDMGIARDDRDMARSLFLPAITAGYAYDRTDRQRAMVDPANPLMPPMYAGEKEFRRAEIKVMMTIWDFGSYILWMLSHCLAATSQTITPP